MAPRRGGDAGAGAQVALAGGRGSFEPPPLKRMHPWQQDGAGQCDIIAGGVDPSGSFKGVYLSSVNLMTLLRTFQLSKAFMPVDMPTPIAALGQSLQDGIPLVVVTRGCFGRQLDYGAGPLRNENQKQVWDTCRQMRADMPQVLITCIDLPINCTSDIVQACLEPPLNEYRELMYHEGTWYTPALIPASSLARWKTERKREKTAKANGAVSFNRKKFGWLDENAFYKDMFTLGWKEVLQVRPAPAAPPRTDLVFVDREKPEVKPIKDATPSAALVTFRKAMVLAREAGEAKRMQAAIKAYLDRAKWHEKEGIEEASVMCQETADLFKTEANLSEACAVIGMAVGALIYANDVEKALQIAGVLKSSVGTDASAEVKATRLVMDCHFALGEVDKALAVATEAKASIDKRGSPEASAEAAGMVLSGLIAKGDFEEAVATASAAAKVSDKASQAKGHLLVAEAHVAKASQSSEEVEKLNSFEEAAKAQKTARGLFKELGRKQDEGEALQGAIGSLLAAEDFTQAMGLAKELQAFSENADTQTLGAMGAQLVAATHLRHRSKVGTYLEGGEIEMLSAAKKAVATFERLNDMDRRGAAQQTLREAIQSATGSD